MGAAPKEPNRSRGPQPKLPEISSFIRRRVNAACTPDAPRPPPAAPLGADITLCHAAAVGTCRSYMDSFTTRQTYLLAMIALTRHEASICSDRW